MVHQQTLHFATLGRGTSNITRQVEDTGMVNIFVQHTSASLILCENADPTVRSDLESFMSRITPDGDPLYQHQDEGPDDMPAHVRTVLTDSSLVTAAWSFQSTGAAPCWAPGRAFTCGNTAPTRTSAKSPSPCTANNL